MEEIAKYKNGNCTITLMSDGTKIREYKNKPKVLFPESIDIKITDYCDMGCAYCHESSTKKGKDGNLDKLLDITKPLPAGVEFAVGGGNPLSHPDLILFLGVLKARGIIANITINQGHLKVYYKLIAYLIKENLVKGIGISITNTNFNYVKKILELSNNVVYHLIAGVNDIKTIDDLILLGECKVLVLGYKVFGFGVNYNSPKINQELNNWYINMPKYIGKCSMSFDNLAIEQLDVKRLFTHDGWDKFYMGNDFEFTMYIDGVKEEYAPTSRSNQRTDYNQMSLLDYFKTRDQK